MEDLSKSDSCIFSMWAMAWRVVDLRDLGIVSRSLLGRGEGRIAGGAR